MTEEQFAVYYKEWEEPIRRMAKKESFGDRDLADDLAQEGAIALSEFEPSEDVENEEAFIRTMLYRRMCNARRGEWRAAGAVALAPGGRDQVKLTLEGDNNLDHQSDGLDAGGVGRARRGSDRSRRRDGQPETLLPQARNVARHRDATPSPDEW